MTVLSVYAKRMESAEALAIQAAVKSEISKRVMDMYNVEDR